MLAAGRWIRAKATMLDVLVPLGVVALFGWLIVRLSSTPIRAEFHPPRRPHVTFHELTWREPWDLKVFGFVDSRQ